MGPTRPQHNRGDDFAAAPEAGRNGDHPPVRAVGVDRSYNTWLAAGLARDVLRPAELHHVALRPATSAALGCVSRVASGARAGPARKLVVSRRSDQCDSLVRN